MTKGVLSVNTTWAKGTNDILTFVIESTPRLKEIKTPCAKVIKGKVVWLVTKSDLEEIVPGLKESQWVSRIPGVADLCKKVPFAEMMAKYKDDDDLSFFPKTWCLPREEGAVPNKGTLILKPDDGSQGDGIFLLQGKDEVMRKLRTIGYNTERSAVVQKYISKPLLLNGFKFDLRLYVIAFVSPGGDWEAYMCKEGLGRVCTEQYSEPTSRNLHKINAHLTNYSISKMAKEYKHDNTGETGSKRLLSAVLRQLKENGVDTDDLWCKLTSMAATTIEIFEQETPPPGCRCFHILGFDAMIDHKHNVHLLEVNNNPSMCINSSIPLDCPDLPAEAAGKKTCKCMSHYKPHVHLPCPTDIKAKGTCVGETLAVLEAMHEQGLDFPSELSDLETRAPSFCPL